MTYNIGDIIGRLAQWLTAPQQIDEPGLPPLHINEAGWLEGDAVVRIPSDPSWYYPKLSTPHGDPIAIVAHVSDTKVGTGVAMAKNRARPRTKDDRIASWHASIEHDHIVQNAPFHVGCWHAIGQIKGAGPANRVSVGLELVGFEKGPWPEGQVKQAMRIWRALVQSYGIKRPLAMVPHAVIDPARRTDPGVPFMKTCAPQILDYAYPNDAR